MRAVTMAAGVAGTALTVPMAPPRPVSGARAVAVSGAGAVAVSGARAVAVSGAGAVAVSGAGAVARSRDRWPAMVTVRPWSAATDVAVEAVCDAMVRARAAVGPTRARRRFAN